MKTSVISIAVGLVIIVGIGVFVYKTKQPVVIPTEIYNTQTPTPTPVKTTPLPSTSTSPTPTRTPTPTPTSSGITYAQIALHNSRSSCWSAINGSVYDLTSWIPNHPGGEARILSICGKDGSSAYNGQHGGESKPARILAGFKIGALAQ